MKQFSKHIKLHHQKSRNYFKRMAKLKITLLYILEEVPCENETKTLVDTEVELENERLSTV